MLDPAQDLSRMNSADSAGGNKDSLGFVPSELSLGRPLGPLRTKRAKDEPKPRLLVANTTEKDV